MHAPQRPWMEIGPRWRLGWHSSIRLRVGRTACVRGTAPLPLLCGPARRTVLPSWETRASVEPTMGRGQLRRGQLLCWGGGSGFAVISGNSVADWAIGVAGRMESKHILDPNAFEIAAQHARTNR